VVAARARQLRNRELPCRKIGKQFERMLERIGLVVVTDGEQDDLRIESLQRQLELLRIRHRDDEVEAGVGLSTLADVLDRHDPRVGSGCQGIRRSRRPPPEARKVDAPDRDSHDERLRALRGRRAGCLDVRDLDDERDAVALRDGLAEPHPRKYLQGVEDKGIRTVLGGFAGLIARRGLAPLQGVEGDQPRPNALELAALVPEGPGPGHAPGLERNADGVAVTDEERQLEPHALAFVARAAVLARLGSVSPALASEECRDPLLIREPHSDVNVVVRPRDRPGVEVNRPPAEEPVLDAVPRQQLVHAPERGELRYCPTGCQTVLSSRKEAMSHGL
jgi:hypothetical protein